MDALPDLAGLLAGLAEGGRCQPFLPCPHTSHRSRQNMGALFASCTCWHCTGTALRLLHCCVLDDFLLPLRPLCQLPAGMCRLPVNAACVRQPATIIGSTSVARLQLE